MKPRTCASVCDEPAVRIAPTIEMAEIAFAADMSGVCSSGGTRAITRKPTNPARTKT